MQASKNFWIAFQDTRLLLSVEQDCGGSHFSWSIGEKILIVSCDKLTSGVIHSALLYFISIVLKVVLP